MRSAEVATEAGVNVQTLRYYERRGLLAAPARLPSGYRDYRPETVRTVRIVKRAQQLGFSLEEIETLLDLAAGGPAGPSARRAVDRAVASIGVDVCIDEVEGAFPSPSVMVDGEDVTGASVSGGARCRLDLPTEQQVRGALQRAMATTR